MIAIGNRVSLVDISATYVDSDAGEAFQLRALLHLKLPLKKRNIVKKDIMKQLKVD